jgi:hypothetical protein
MMTLSTNISYKGEKVVIIDLTNEELYRKDTGKEPHRTQEISSEGVSYTLDFYTDEYVWWLEAKLEAGKL